MLTRKCLLLFVLIPFYSDAQDLSLGIPFGHTAPVEFAEFSHNGKWIVSASWEDKPIIWESSTGRMLFMLKGHSSRIVAARFSPDDKYLLSASYDRTVKLWEVASGKLIYTIAEFKYEPASISFSNDGKQILVADMFERKLTIYNSMDGKIQKTIAGFTSNIRSASFSKDDRFIGVVVMDSIAWVMDVVTGKKLFELKGHQKDISTLSFSPNKKRIATAAKDGFVKIWDVSTGNIIKTFSKQSSQINSLSFSPNSKMLATVSKGEELIIYDTETGNSLKTISGIQEPLLVDFNDNGSLLLISSGRGHINIYSSSSGELVQSLKKHTFIVSAAALSNNAEMIVSYWDGFPRVWDLKNGQVNNVIPLDPNDGITIVHASHDGNWYLRNSTRKNLKVYKRGKSVPEYQIQIEETTACIPVFSKDDQYFYINDKKNLRCFELKSGKEIYKSEVEGEISAPVFDNQNKMLLTRMGGTFVKNSIVIWDAFTGKLIQTIDTNGEVNSAEFSKDGNFIFAKCDDYLIKSFDVKTGNELSSLIVSEQKYWSFTQLPDQERIVSWHDEGDIKLWSIKDQKLIKSWKAHDDIIKRVNFSNDGKYFVSTSSDYTAKIWNSSDGSLYKSLNGHTQVVNSAVFINNNKNILSYSEDTQIKLWNAKTGDLICSFIALDDGYITILPSGFYQGDKASIKQLYYINGMTTIGFEQLDIKYNRPDKILEALGNTDSILIKSYKKAYEKRIKKLNIDTTQFQDNYSVPNADFANRDKIAFEQKAEKLTLQIKANSNTNNLERLNVWVNEVPIYGLRGINLYANNSNKIDTSIEIKLSQGKNRIETSVTNVNSYESYRAPLIVNFSPLKKQKELIQFIGIGIDRFAESKNNLQYSSKDIRDLSLKLKEKYGDDIFIDTLFNEKVTKEKVKALKESLKKTSINDKVIISYSGHGLLNKEYDYYLSTYNVNFEKPEQNGLPYDDLESLLDSIPARKKLMLIDACHSGEVDKDELTTINQTTNTLKLIKGTKVFAYKKDEKHLGLKNSFELMQNLFVNVGKSTGATIISAAAGTQFALERNDLKNGVFTYSILELMQQKQQMKVSQLKSIVSKRVEELTKGLQKPTSRNEAIAVDWNVW